MKHFLPSTIMLTPFLVRYYDEEDDETEVVETNLSLKEKEQQTEIIE